MDNTSEIESGYEPDERAAGEVADQVKKIFAEKSKAELERRRGVLKGVPENASEEDLIKFALPEQESLFQNTDKFFGYEEREDILPATTMALELMRKLVSADGKPIEPRPELFPKILEPEGKQYLLWEDLADATSWVSVVQHVINHTVQKQGMADYRAQKLAQKK